MKKISFLFILSFLLVNSALTQIYGCTDLNANNYEATATINDGSCTYNSSTITPTSSFNLDNVITETSGLILWNNHLWTHNDSGGNPSIYTIDTLDGALLQTLPLSSILNIDWEEISQDSNYIYIGDFGNNVTGNRTDLKIFRIAKNSILVNAPIIDTIRFSYSNQTDYTATTINNTNFDCEAFIVSEDSIYLFTKQWVDGKTRSYSLPKIPGNYIAHYKSTMNVLGLITGAVYLESKKLVALCGYTKLLQPFFYLLYDFNDFDFFNGNKRKINVNLPYHQIEGITSKNGLKYYASNEFFQQSAVLQKLHIFDLTTYLADYLESSLTVNPIEPKTDFKIYPIPASNFITIETKTDYINENYVLLNQLGQVVLSGKMTKENQQIDISILVDGMYLLKIGEEKEQIIKLVKN